MGDWVASWPWTSKLFFLIWKKTEFCFHSAAIWHFSINIYMAVCLYLQLTCETCVTFLRTLKQHFLTLVNSKNVHALCYLSRCIWCLILCLFTCAVPPSTSPCTLLNNVLKVLYVHISTKKESSGERNWAVPQESAQHVNLGWYGWQCRLLGSSMCINGVWCLPFVRGGKNPHPAHLLR